MDKLLYIDTHTHYCDRQFNDDRDDLLKELEPDFYAVVEIGCDYKTSEEAIRLSEKFDMVYAAVGIHPSDVKYAALDRIDRIRQLAKHPKAVAIGEIGLDYHWDKDEDIKALQKRAFILQMQIARECKLPIVVHSREAAADTLDIIKSHGSDLTGIIHCYAYSYEMAKEYVKMGYFLGIGGVVTYDNAPRLHEVVQKIPPEHLVLETDCPYLSPVPNRGKRNSSLNLCYVAEKIAALKGMSKEEVLAQVYKNSRAVYNI